MSRVHKRCYMELILGISEETNFLESLFLSLPKFSLLLHRQTLAPDFKRLKRLLGGSTGVLAIWRRNIYSTAIKKKKNSSVRRTNSAQAINSADGGIDFTLWKSLMMIWDSHKNKKVTLLDVALLLVHSSYGIGELGSPKYLV